jgi:hypothetical protein
MGSEVAGGMLSRPVRTRTKSGVVTGRESMAHLAPFFIGVQRFRMRETFVPVQTAEVVP